MPTHFSCANAQETGSVEQDILPVFYYRINDNYCRQCISEGCYCDFVLDPVLYSICVIFQAENVLPLTTGEAADKDEAESDEEEVAMDVTEDVKDAETPLESEEPIKQ